MAKKITKLPETWEAVCKIKGIDPIKSLPFQGDGENDTEQGVNAFFQLSTIREVLNAGKDADWGNHNESKWVVWPNVIRDSSKPSGFGLSADVCDYVYASTYASVGSRLSFNSRELAVHAFTHFQPIFEKFMLITNKWKI